MVVPSLKFPGLLQGLKVVSILVGRIVESDPGLTVIVAAISHPAEISSDMLIVGIVNVYPVRHTAGGVIGEKGHKIPSLIYSHIVVDHGTVRVAVSAR